MRVTSRHLYQAWDVFLIMTVTLAAVEIPVRAVLDLGGTMASMDWAVSSILLLDILRALAPSCTAARPPGLLS